MVFHIKKKRFIAPEVLSNDNSKSLKLYRDNFKEKVDYE